MQWFAVFFGCLWGRFAPCCAQKGHDGEKGKTPVRGLGLSELFLAVKIFYF